LVVAMKASSSSMWPIYAAGVVSAVMVLAVTLMLWLA
jgi:hypothetical protein